MEEAPPDARDRIIQAALKQFAELGFKGATVRGIAADAGVSPGLVQHHFPTKKALRDECDSYLFAVMRRVEDDGFANGAIGDPSFLAEAHHALAMLAPYVARATLEDSTAASKLFDELAVQYRRILTSGEFGPAIPEGEDVDAIVAVHTAMQLGLAVFDQQMYRQLNVDEADPAMVARIGRARLYLSTTRIVNEEIEFQVRKALERYEHTRRPSS